MQAQEVPRRERRRGEAGQAPRVVMVARSRVLGGTDPWRVGDEVRGALRGAGRCTVAPVHSPPRLCVGVGRVEKRGPLPRSSRGCRRRRGTRGTGVGGMGWGWGWTDAEHELWPGVKHGWHNLGGMGCGRCVGAERRQASSDPLSLGAPLLANTTAAPSGHFTLSSRDADHTPATEIPGAHVHPLVPLARDTGLCPSTTRSPSSSLSSHRLRG